MTLGSPRHSSSPFAAAVAVRQAQQGEDYTHAGTQQHPNTPAPRPARRSFGDVPVSPESAEQVPVGAAAAFVSSSGSPRGGTRPAAGSSGAAVQTAQPTGEEAAEASEGSAAIQQAATAASRVASAFPRLSELGLRVKDRQLVSSARACSPRVFGCKLHSSLGRGYCKGALVRAFFAWCDLVACCMLPTLKAV